MPDAAQRVDPAALEAARDALSAHAEYLRDLAKVEENPFAQLGLQDAARRADKAAGGYAEMLRTPALPDEPPDGTVLRGSGTDVWQRDDDDPNDPSRSYRDVAEHWWLTGAFAPCAWAEAHEKGADPARRLVELPNPDDRRAVAVLSHVAMKHLDDDAVLRLDHVAAVVRALAEQGAPDAD